MLEEIAANDWGLETARNLAGIEMQVRGGRNRLTNVDTGRVCWGSLFRP